MWCQVTGSQESLSLEACSGSQVLMCPCFCSTYFILVRQIQIRDGERNAPVLLLKVSYSLHTDKVYGCITNVSTSLLMP